MTQGTKPQRNGSRDETVLHESSKWGTSPRVVAVSTRKGAQFRRTEVPVQAELTRGIAHLSPATGAANSRPTETPEIVRMPRHSLIDGELIPSVGRSRV